MIRLMGEHVIPKIDTDPRSAPTGSAPPPAVRPDSTPGSRWLRTRSSPRRSGSRCPHGDLIPAYLARPLRDGPHPGVVVIHHMPGYDESTKEIARTFAVNGYTALCPNLHHREAPEARRRARPSQAVRDAGGVPDARCVGDVDARGAVPARSAVVERPRRCDRLLLGRTPGVPRRVLAAVRRRGRLLRRWDQREPRPAHRAHAGRPDRPHPNLSCPLLGLFGAEDRRPSPADVAAIEAGADPGKARPFEFHTYADAGHAFFSVDRPFYRVEAALDGWQRIWDFFGDPPAAGA